MDGPGESEASGTNRADRITAPCRQLIVVYQFGSQGAYENERPITITADTLVTGYGESWKNENGALPFYPEAEAQHTKRALFVITSSSHRPPRRCC